MKFSLFRLVPVFLFIIGLVALWLGENLFFARPPSHLHSLPTAGLTPEFMVQAAVTAILLVATLLVILSKRYADADKRWAYTTIGTIVGFWLKTST